jgi:hypothetical protein
LPLFHSADPSHGEPRVRLWTFAPRYLDAVGLVALWREALLARAVLAGATRGYRHHPQLIRFRQQPDPLGCINLYLRGIYEEAHLRGYRFDEGKLALSTVAVRSMTETRGQVETEWAHLLDKLQGRDPDRCSVLRRLRRPKAHPLFRIVRGPRREWERRTAGP